MANYTSHAIMANEVYKQLKDITSKEWIDVGHKDKAFVINIGEFLELATNGYLKATMENI